MMDKKLFINTISKELKKYDFKKIPNTKYQWSKKEENFSSVIYVYKSYYSDTFLMEYAFNFDGSIHEKNEFDLVSPIHLGSTNIDIDEIFDLDNEINDITRTIKIHEILSFVIESKLKHISSVQELYIELKNHQDSYMISYSALNNFEKFGFETSDFQ